jgi:hypothetical protein
LDHKVTYREQSKECLCGLMLKANLGDFHAVFLKPTLLCGNFDDGLGKIIGLILAHCAILQVHVDSRPPTAAVGFGFCADADGVAGLRISRQIAPKLTASPLSARQLASGWSNNDRATAHLAIG